MVSELVPGFSRVLARVIALWSWGRKFTLTVSPPGKEYKWVPTSSMLGATLLHPTKTRISWGLMGHLAQIIQALFFSLRTLNIQSCCYFITNPFSLRLAHMCGGRLSDRGLKIYILWHCAVCCWERGWYLTWTNTIIKLTLVVRKVDNGIHRINHYPLNIHFISIYPAGE